MDENWVSLFTKHIKGFADGLVMFGTDRIHQLVSIL
jgi:hypothetical protein